jgi:hypothetical protein
MRLSVNYFLQQGANHFGGIRVEPVVADQFNNLSTTLSTATIPTTSHVAEPNDVDFVMTAHDLTRTPGDENRRDELLGTARASSVVDADVSLESQQSSNTGQVIMTIGSETSLSTLTESAAGISFSHPLMEHALVSTSQGVGASSRQPVEIDVNSIRTTLAGGGAEVAKEQETLMYPTDCVGSSDLLTQLLEPQDPPSVHHRRIWRTTGDPHSTHRSSRLAKHLVWIFLCVVLIALGYHGVMSFFFSSAKASSGDGGGGDAPNKDPRAAQVLDCARILSSGRGLAERTRILPHNGRQFIGSQVGALEFTLRSPSSLIVFGSRPLAGCMA